MRITNSEYERGWWDCFDKIYGELENIKSPSAEVLFMLDYLDKLEKEFNEASGL